MIALLQLPAPLCVFSSGAAAFRIVPGDTKTEHLCWLHAKGNLMRAVTRFSMLTLGLAMIIGFSSAGLSRAEDAAPAKVTGTISGKVVDGDGKAVKGATVNAVLGGEVAPAPGQGGARPAR